MLPELELKLAEGWLTRKKTPLESPGEPQGLRGKTKDVVADSIVSVLVMKQDHGVGAARQPTEDQGRLAVSDSRLHLAVVRPEDVIAAAKEFRGGLTAVMDEPVAGNDRAAVRQRGSSRQ